MNMYFVCGASGKFNDTCLTGMCTFNMHHCYKLLKKNFPSVEVFPPGKLHQIVFPSVESFPQHNSIDGKYISSFFHRWNEAHPEEYSIFKKFSSVGTSSESCFHRWKRTLQHVASGKSAALKSKTCFHRWKHIHVKLTKWFHRC